MAAILITLVVGLVGCAAFAIRVIGPFNPVSIAFAPLFIGIAIDFGIQFSVRYSAERLTAEPVDAMRKTAAGVGLPLTVAAVATAVGFMAFAPTAYLGVRDLGLIAGTGMVIALALNLTLLPALLGLFRAGAERHAAGFAWGAPMDRAAAVEIRFQSGRPGESARRIGPHPRRSDGGSEHVPVHDRIPGGPGGRARRRREARLAARGRPGAEPRCLHSRRPGAQARDPVGRRDPPRPDALTPGRDPGADPR